MSNEKPIGAVIYDRVSTKRQAVENNSLAAQAQATKEFCQRNNWHLLRIFDDPGESGRSVDRPGFQQMLKYCREHRIGYVVVYDLSRFSRNAPEQGMAIAALLNCGTSVRSVCEPHVDETAAGRFAANMIAASNQYFSDALSERTRERMRFAFDSGRYLQTAPVGYDNVKCAARGQANIVPNAAEAALVLKSFQLVEAGNHRPADVLRTMIAMGLRSKKGNPPKLHAFLNMLRNPVYIGKVRSKKRNETKQGLHQPIVEERTFNNVQQILNGKKPAAAPYTRNREDFPLRRFLRCSECGTPLTGAPAKGENGTKYGYYWCYKCHAVKSLRTEKAANEFKELLSRLRPTAFLIAELPAILKQEWSKRTFDSTAVQNRLKAQLHDKLVSHEKLVLAHLNGDKSIETVYERMARKFQEEIAALESQIAEAEMERASFADLWEFCKSLLVDIPSAWEKADVDQKQRVQNILFPSGLNYHPEQGILNSDNDCLFKQLESFVTGKIHLARPERFELPT